MFSREDLMNKRDLLMAKRDVWMAKRDAMMARRDEMMERADRIREDFMDNVDPDTVTMAVGLSLVSGGVAWGVTQVLRGRRMAMSIVAPVGLVALGLTIAGRGAMHRRATHIDRVRDELSGLGPLARKRVLRDVMAEHHPFVRHSEN